MTLQPGATLHVHVHSAHFSATTALNAAEAPAAQENKQRDAFVCPGARRINISLLTSQTFTSGLNPLLLLIYANTV